MASVDKRPDGRWRARWREYPGGPQRSRQFRTREEAKAHLATVEHDLRRGAYLTPEAAATPFDRYLEVYRSRQVWRQSSHELHERAVARALEAWRDRPLSTIQRTDVQALVSAMSHLAPNTVKTYLAQLSGVFAMAVDDHYLARNPCHGVKRPRHARAAVVPLTVEEVHRLYDAAPEWFRIAIVVGAGLGIRQSEARGLTVDRVRFLRREVLIDRQLARSELEWGPTKNSKVRTIPTDAVVLDAISAHVARHGEGEHGLVLHLDGRYLGSWRFGETWRILRARAGLPDARYHDLRHHLASELLGDRMSHVAVADILGDEPATILSTYAHLVVADHDRTRATMRRIWTRDEDVAGTRVPRMGM